MRKIFSWIIISLISLILSLVVLAGLIFYRFGNGEMAKQALANQNFYQRILDLTPKLLIENSSQKIPYSEQEIAKVTTNAVSGKDIQSNFEKIIDDFYSWLSGSNPNFHINIDLTPYKTKSKSELTQVVKDHFYGLPECNANEMLKLQRGEDLEKLNCRPSYEILSSVDFSASANDFLTQLPDSINYSPSEKIASYPSYYKSSLLFLKIGLLALVVLIILLIILMRNEKRKLLKTLGSTFLRTGIPILIFCFIENYFSDRLIGSTANLAADVPPELTASFSGIISFIASILNQDLLKIGIALTVIGAILFGSCYLIPKSEKI